jgi:hypothetical protein
MLSKTLDEEAVWKFAKENGLEILRTGFHHGKKTTS